MLVVLIAHVDVVAVYVQFSYPFPVVGDVLFTHDPLASKSESRHLSSMFMCVSPWVVSPLLLPPVLPCHFLFLPPPALRAAHWARKPDRHAKPALLREQGEWRRLRRLRLPHKLWAQLHGLQRAQRLFRFLLLQLSRHRTRTWMTWHSASCSQRHTEDKPITANQKACQSVSRRLSCSIEQGNLRETDVDQSIGFGVTRNTYSAHSKLSENTQAEKVVDRSWKPEERESSNAQIRTLLEEKRQMSIEEYCEKIGHHELQAARAEERRILQEELWRQQKDFREVHQQSLTEMEEWRKFQSSPFDTIARRKLFEDQNTILELSGRVHELQNEVNCMNNSKDFQDAESVRSGNSQSTSVFPTSSNTRRIVEAFLPIAVPQRRAAKHLGHTWYIGKRFLQIHRFPLTAPYPQELNPWKKIIEEPLHMSTAEKSERPERNQDLRCQSGPSAKASVIISGGDSSKNYGADQQRLPDFWSPLCQVPYTSNLPFVRELLYQEVFSLHFRHFFCGWFAVWYSFQPSLFPYLWPCGRPFLV